MAWISNSGLCAVISSMAFDSMLSSSSWPLAMMCRLLVVSRGPARGCGRTGSGGVLRHSGDLIAGDPVTGGDVLRGAVVLRGLETIVA